MNPWSHTLGVLPARRVRPVTAISTCMINAYWEPLDFAIQEGVPGTWSRSVDTSLPSPDDIAPPGGESSVPGASYRVGPRSIVVLNTL